MVIIFILRKNFDFTEAYSSPFVEPTHHPLPTTYACGQGMFFEYRPLYVFAVSAVVLPDIYGCGIRSPVLVSLINNVVPLAIHKSFRTKSRI